MSNKGQPLPGIDAAAPWDNVAPNAASGAWGQLALQALARMAALPDNWDGYGSPPISRAAIQSARRLVAMLDNQRFPPAKVVPVTGGGINFSWQVKARELDIEILPDGSAEYLTVETDPATGAEKTREEPLLLDPPTAAQALADWLIGN